MQEFHCKTRVVFGPDGLDWLKTRSFRQLLLVTDPYFAQNGWAERIAGLVDVEQRLIWDQVKPDPSVELAAEGTALMREKKPDLLIALGGGSAMDTAKAMVYFAGENVTFVAIPTTSGSGSEVTDFSILTHGDVKHPLIHKRMQPDTALLIPELVQNLPPSLVADGGFDVLSHALESFVATKADPISRSLAADAFSVVFTQLSKSFRGDTSVRGEIHLASTMAGMAFSQSGLGLCHALSHALGGVLHIPHGRLNAILLPHVVALNTETAGNYYAQLARQAGLGGSSDLMAVRNLRNGLIRLRRELRLPATLKEAGVPPQKLRQHGEVVIAAALKDPCMATNPRPADTALLREILEAVRGG